MTRNSASFRSVISSTTSINLVAFPSASGRGIAWTRALNLVVRQGGTATGASMQRIEGTASWAADCAELMAVYAETGGVQIQRGAATEVLAAQQLGWRRLAAGERVAVQAASAWVMRVPLAAP